MPLSSGKVGFIGLALIGICFVLLPQLSQQADTSISSILKSNKLTSIIEWQTYVKLYKKSYSSLSQELARKKIFLARVVEVFVTSFKFKFYQLSYHTAINKYSDLSPEESKILLSGEAPASSTGASDDDGPMDDAEARELLLDMIASSDSFSGNRDSIEQELRSERVSALKKLKRRRRRSISSSDNRDLKINDLIKLPNEASENSSGISKLKIQRVVPPENPDYEPPPKKVHVTAPDSSLHLGDITAHEVNEIEHSINGDKTESPGLLRNAFNGVVGWFSSGDDENANNSASRHGDDDDIIIIRDWRQTGCISPAIDQGYCASCYAVSSMAYVEWAYCMNQDNVLTPLSAQYMVSCGMQFKEETEGKMNFNGCNQGSTKQTMYFVKEYGVELEDNMPYLAMETECPIEPFTPLKKKGYIRPNVKQPIRLSGKTTQLDLALKNGPVLVSMRNPTSFIVHGGGMVDSCSEDGGHAMLVIGNMIEDGTEYLMVKNSFGPDWGTEGFFKLKRSAVKECVKEFVVPVISFPSKKAQSRRVKAYLMRSSQQSDDNVPVQLDHVDGEKFQVDRLFSEEGGN